MEIGGDDELERNPESEIAAEADEPGKQIDRAV